MPFVADFRGGCWRREKAIEPGQCVEYTGIRNVRHVGCLPADWQM